MDIDKSSMHLIGFLKCEGVLAKVGGSRKNPTTTAYIKDIGMVKYCIQKPNRIATKKIRVGFPDKNEVDPYISRKWYFDKKHHKLNWSLPGITAAEACLKAREFFKNCRSIYAYHTTMENRFLNFIGVFGHGQMERVLLKSKRRWDIIDLEPLNFEIFPYHGSPIKECLFYAMQFKSYLGKRKFDAERFYPRREERQKDRNFWRRLSSRRFVKRERRLLSEELERKKKRIEERRRSENEDEDEVRRVFEREEDYHQ